MSIELHCTHCNNLVRAPDDAGGRKGKCPYCHQEVYIPTPPDQIETLDFAEDDASWEQEKKRLDEEAKSIRDALRKEKETPEESSRPPDSRAASPGPRSASSPASAEAGVEGLVLRFLSAMKESRLDDAQAAVKQLAGRAEEAKRLAQQMSMDPMPPPELGDLPPGVMQGFLKSLISQL